VFTEVLPGNALIKSITISFLNPKGARIAKTGPTGWQMVPGHAFPRRKDDNIYIFFISCDAITATLPYMYYVDWGHGTYCSYLPNGLKQENAVLAVVFT
jgi:hypothetical protein